ncbi:MAG: glycosyltransferase [Acidobacteria bacterium]|nr:glycosyltransferase [Acidobacteriota bacterium]
MTVALLVLGMHRSGSSALAGALELLGVPLGGPLMPPARDNERGFFELAGMVALHDELLEALGGSWSHPPALEPGFETSPAGVKAQEKLEALLTGNFGGKPLWAVKDPRLSLLLPLWRPVLAKLGVEPRVIFCTRDPWEVARSLEVRNGLPAFEALGLWLGHSADGELASRGDRRVFTAFETLLADPLRELYRIGAALGIAWPKSPHAARADLEAFLSKDLRHWNKPRPPREASILDAPFAKAEAALVALSASDDEAARQRLTAAVSEALDALVAVAPKPKTHVAFLLPSAADSPGSPAARLVPLAAWLAENAAIAPRFVLREGGPLEPSLRRLGDTVVLGASSLDPSFLSGAHLAWATTGTLGPLVTEVAAAGLPVLVEVRELDYELGLHGGTAAIGAESARRILAVSEAVRGSLFVTFGVPEEKIDVLLPGLDIGALESAANAGGRGLRESLGIPKDAPLVVAAGPATWEQGADLLVLVALRLRALSPRDETRFVWAGAAPGPVETVRLEHDAARAGLGGRIRFAGDAVSRAGLLGAADVVLVPAREDAFPDALLEGAALGKPVVSFDGAGGAGELLVDGRGFLAPYLDVNSMAGAVFRLLRDPALRKETGRLAEATVRARHNHVCLGERVSASISKYALGEGLRPKVDTAPAAPLPDEAFRLTWLSWDLPFGAPPARAVPVSLTLRNDGPHRWPDLAATLPDRSGRNAVRLGYRWKRADGSVPEDNGARVELPAAVAPGASLKLEAGLVTPTEPGEYVLELDLVQEFVSWFSARGGATLEVPMTIEAE